MFFAYFLTFGLSEEKDFPYSLQGAYRKFYGPFSRVFDNMEELRDHLLNVVHVSDGLANEIADGLSFLGQYSTEEHYFGMTAKQYECIGAPENTLPSPDEYIFINYHWLYVSFNCPELYPKNRVSLRRVIYVKAMHVEDNKLKLVWGAIDRYAIVQHSAWVYDDWTPLLSYQLNEINRYQFGNLTEYDYLMKDHITNENDIIPAPTESIYQTFEQFQAPYERFDFNMSFFNFDEFYNNHTLITWIGEEAVVTDLLNNPYIS